MRATKALIHLDRFGKNIEAVRAHIGEGPRICMPVKADAYGHGAAAVAGEALRKGASFLAVATVQEGISLREEGAGAPILLFSVPLPEELDSAFAHRLIPFITDREFAEAAAAAAARAGVTAPVHLKIDTGMGRVGCRPEEAPGLARFIASCPSLLYAGTATHLARSDSREPDAVSATKQQINRFKEALGAIRNAGIDPGIVHAANSGATLLHKDAHFDMVRPGILLYGYPPSPELADISFTEPVMELVSQLVFIKKVKKGEAVSYGGTWTAPCDRFIGTIPVGYGDGLPRSLSGGGFTVRIRGKQYPVAGRICMDQCMVDLGAELEAARWDQVTLFGKGTFTAADIAERLHTIPYEITCNINKRVPRSIERGAGKD
ncbi:MAG: alanine racemase [Spirochaetaceae bacterium]|nr:alanine racemase [Spirochaetaceae bacterium]